MIIYKYADDVIYQINKFRDAKETIGFVPTMGALHQGHISLIEKSKENCGATVCSIFINPTQFNNKDDLKKYPVTIEQDIYLLEKNGCDVLFLPDVDEIYPDGTKAKEHFDLGYLETILEGKFRSGHFQGVCQVVKRLLQIVHSTHLFLGQKDYQQCMVIKKLLELMHSSVDLIICPTQRGENGLAMSSRNMRLNEQQKEQASEIYKTLIFIKSNLLKIPVAELKDQARQNLEHKNFKVDYVEIADANNLRLINDWNDTKNYIALIAAYIDNVRLIDNLQLT